MGCVGKDDSSRILSEKVRFGIFPGLAQERIVLPFNVSLFQAKECGVKVSYQQSDKPTGISSEIEMIYLQKSFGCGSL